MKIFKNKSSKENVEKELAFKNFQVKHLFHTLNFLAPDKSEEEITETLIFMLTAIAEPKLLSALVDEYNKLGATKLDEVTDLYENFYSPNETDNNE